MSPSAYKENGLQPFPSPTGGDDIQWDGSVFLAAESDVLAYPMPGAPKGWNDALTDFHEEVTTGHHPIDQASIQIAVQSALAACRGKDVPKILEVGCSSGFLLRRLRREKPEAAICGADIIDEPLRRLAQSLRDEGLPTPLLRFDLTTCPLPDDSFDVVIALNVLEHIEDNARALAEVDRILKPGGAFIFEVPAGPGLYDDYDRELHHYRRYEARGLDAILTRARLRREKLSHLGAFMFPAFWVVKKLRARGQSRSGVPQANKPDQPSALTRRLITGSSGLLFKVLFAVELGLGRYINWPFGIRCVGVYVKP